MVKITISRNTDNYEEYYYSLILGMFAGLSIGIIFQGKIRLGIITLFLLAGGGLLLMRILFSQINWFNYISNLTAGGFGSIFLAVLMSDKLNGHLFEKILLEVIVIVVALTFFKCVLSKIKK
ncbi:hypothetical protein HYV86_01275 [Candidatus Woesearchaeota archaeon]|nr:hypothetical protein [Candidatus Woesearchaeota archaeon]